MTCIVGLIDNNRVWIGGDSAGVSGLDVSLRKDPKVFKNGNFLIGYTSSFRMGQLLRFKFNPPKYYAAQHSNDEYKYMCTDFIESVRVCFKDGGYATVLNNEESGGSFLVGFNGRLFKIDSDFQVGESVEKYNSIGCGDSYAKGSLYTIFHFPNNKVRDPNDVIITALLAAEHFSGGVKSPFLIEHI